VEGRFPFLDPELFAFAAALPEVSKLCGLREKEILRRWARDIVPATVVARHKQPYRAPDSAAFFGAQVPEYVRELLDPAALQQTGIFSTGAVAGLVRRANAGKAVSDAENQALVAILSTQLWHREFCATPADAEPLAWLQADVVIDEATAGAV
jgi:asparagine synthase (glutamine-hydrolysing)